MERAIVKDEEGSTDSRTLGELVTCHCLISPVHISHSIFIEPSIKVGIDS